MCVDDNTFDISNEIDNLSEFIYEGNIFVVTNNVLKNLQRNNGTVFRPSYLLVQLEATERSIFFILYLLCFSLSMIANIATLYTTPQRKNRLIQKFLICSLAISDIFVCIFFGINNMINYSKPMANWVLGDFMCSFVPFMQQVGPVANALTIVLIAFDRYRSIVHPLNKQWDPNIYFCILIMLGLWGFAAGVSVPIYLLQYLSSIFVLIMFPNSNIPLSNETLHLYICTTSHKEYHKIIYIVLFCIIFIPLMLMFLWLYFKIAQLIWKRRKPIKIQSKDNTSVTIETSTDSKTSIEKVKMSPVVNQVNKHMKSIMKTKKLHMEKKIRTFKIILIIMAVFFVCRMPHYLFNLIKLSKSLNERKHWIMANSFSFLLLLNTTLNPFLYSFLNQAMSYIDKFFISIGDFISNICCCCCSNSEFDGFEKDNPFSPENFDARPSQSSSIIPKGPCLDTKNNHVKFQDVAVLNTNSNNYLNCRTF